MAIAIKSEDKRIVYGEVYAPNRPDSDGEFMTSEHIEKAAHEFMRAKKLDQIDVLHNNKVVDGCCVVESFIAREDDKVFLPGSWVVGVYVADPGLWESIKKGEINGFSMEAFVTRHPQEVELEIPPVVRGRTSKSEDHEHEFYVTYDSNGLFRGGTTNVVNGHCHQIVNGTHTSSVNGHSHRFSAVDDVTVVRN